MLGSIPNMLEYITNMLVSILSAFIGGITSIYIAKRIMFSRDNIMESVDSVLEYALNTVEGQMKVKAVMEKIGEGITKGIIPRTGNQRMKPMDLLMMLGMGYLQKSGIIPQNLLGQPQEQQT